MLAQYETQLKYRRFDENGDVLFGHGNSDFVSGADAMKQVIQTRLAAVEGEWWEGDDGALPWFTDIIGMVLTENRIAEIDLMIISRIMDTVGVISVSDITSGVSNRRYHFSCTAHTVYGDVPVEVER